jgi:hypothetical protein
MPAPPAGRHTSGSGRCPTRPLPRHVQSAMRQRHASSPFPDSFSKPTPATSAPSGTTTMGIAINMPRAEGGTAVRQRTFDRYSSREGIESKGDRVAEVVLSRPEANAFSCSITPTWVSGRVRGSGRGRPGSAPQPAPRRRRHGRHRDTRRTPPQSQPPSGPPLAAARAQWGPPCRVPHG